jgi:hypothetical protein
MLSLIILSLPVWGQAETLEIEISIEEIFTVPIGERTYPGFMLTLSEQVSEESFVKANLAVRAQRSPGCEEDFFTVQVAHLENGMPVVPTRKTGFISEMGFSEASEDLYLDLTSMVRHCLAGGIEDPTLVLGAIGENGADCAQLEALDPSQNLWAKVQLLTRD